MILWIFVFQQKICEIYEITKIYEISKKFTWFNRFRPFSIIQIKKKEMVTFLGWGLNLEKIKENPRLRHDISFLYMIIIKFKEVLFNSRYTAIATIQGWVEQSYLTWIGITIRNYHHHQASLMLFGFGLVEKSTE